MMRSKTALTKTKGHPTQTQVEGQRVEREPEWAERRRSPASAEGPL